MRPILRSPLFVALRSALGRARQGSGTPPVLAAPVNTAAPVVSGATPAGSMLTSSPGTWTGYPYPTFAYQWYAGASAISGATSNTYTSLIGQVGTAITCRVTATNSQGSPAAVASNGITVTAALAAPVNTVAPTTSGATTQGGSRTRTDGTWTGVPTPTITRNWQLFSGGVWGDMAGETGTSLTIPAPGDYRLRVRGVNSQGTVDAYSSQFTATGALAAPVNVTPPASSGSVIVGGVRTTTDGVWTGNPSPTFGYQWQENIATVWTNVSGQTANTFTNPSAGEFRCVVTATNSQGSASANSNSAVVTTASGISTAFDPYYSGGFTLDQGTGFVARPSVSKPGSKASGYATASFTDPDYATRIYRATDVADSADASQTYLRHEYSRKKAFNADSTYFIAQSTNGFWYLYNAQTFAKVNGGRTSTPGNTGLGTGSTGQFAGDCEPTWHPTNPDKLWYTDQNGGLTWYEFDIPSKTRSTLFTLSGKLAAVGMSAGTRAWWQGEGRPSDDGRWWGLSVQDNSFAQIGLIMYDRQTDTIVGSAVTTNKPNNVSTSPLGNYVIPSWSNGSGQNMTTAAAAGINSCDGTRAYVRDFSTFQQMSYYGEHADTGLDADGNEVYISGNYNSGNMPDVTDGAMYMRRMDNGVATSLPVNFYGGAASPAFHISGCMGRPGWAVCGTYSGTGGTSGGTTKYDEQILLVELVTSASRVYRLCHHQTRYNDYWDEPHCTVNSDGTMFIFASDFAGTNRESYVIGLPSWAIPVAGAVVPVNSVAPSISGTATPGGTLTANPGTWSGSPSSYAYQWIKNGVDESGQTASTYTAPASGTITVRVTATGAGGTGSPATSSGVVITALAAPVNTVAPVVSGSTNYGSVLSCTTGTWTGNPTPTYTYQWKKAGVNISGETASTYTTVLGDVAASVTCDVTATNSQGSASQISNGITVTAPSVPSVVQSVVADMSGANTNSTGAVTTTNGCTLLAFIMSEAGGGGLTVSDSKGNTWTLVQSSIDATGGGVYNDHHIYKCEGATGGASHTFTAAGTGRYPSIILVELPPGATVTQSNIVRRTNPNPYLTNALTIGSNKLVLAYAGFQRTFAAAPTFTWNNSFVAVAAEAGNNDHSQAVGRLAPSAGSVTGSVTVVGSTPIDGAAALLEIT